MERPSAAGRWLDRNAKWFLPLAIVAFLGLSVAGVLAFFRWFDAYSRSLPPYRMALQQLRAHEEASDLLGPPIEAKGQIQGNWEVSSRASSARLTIPVEGSRAKGTLFVSASAVGEDWRLSAVTLQIGSPPRRIPIMKTE